MQFRWSVRAWWARHGGVRLRSALAAATVVAAAVLLAVAALVLTARLTLTGNIDAAASQRAAQVVEAVRSGDQGRVDQELQPSAGDQTLVQILNTDGTVRAASPALEGEQAVTRLRPEAGQTVWEKRAIHIAAADPFRILAMNVTTDQGQFIVVVAQSVRPVDESIEAITEAIAFGAPVLTAISGLAAFWFVGRSLRPVEAIRRQTRIITARHLSTRVPVPAAQDEIAALATTMNDMLDRLQASAEAQRRFIADASHELRSPLTTLQVGLDLLSTTETPAPAQVQRLRAETSRLSRLMSDLLLLARVEEHIARPGVDVDVDDLVFAHRERLQAAHPALLVTAQVRPVRVVGDPGQLDRALRNLCDNAARHARAGVALTLWQDETSAHLTVSDDGAGISQGDRDRVFDRFVRLDEARTRADGGFGLGLAITKEIVIGHGGSISVESGSDGGACLHVTLPLQLG